jgi:hypothetical protein
VIRQSCAIALVSEEPDELITHVWVCGAGWWLTAGSTRRPTPWIAVAFQALFSGAADLVSLSREAPGPCKQSRFRLLIN